MNPNDTSARVLTALFELARDVKPIDIISISQQASVSVYVALKAMETLAESGLVRPRQLRLTFLGLAAASTLAARCRNPLEASDDELLAWTEEQPALYSRRPRAA